MVLRDPTKEVQRLVQLRLGASCAPGTRGQRSNSWQHSCSSRRQVSVGNEIPGLASTPCHRLPKPLLAGLSAASGLRSCKMPCSSYESAGASCQPQSSPAAGRLLLEYPLGLTSAGGRACAMESSAVLLSGPALQSKPHPANLGGWPTAPRACAHPAAQASAAQWHYLGNGLQLPSSQLLVHLRRQRAAQHSCIQKVYANAS